MSSIARVQGMRARALTIMATRSQDQDLVASVAAKSGIRDRSAFASVPDTQHAPEKIVPAFGWHPWFSYQLYDDTEGGGGSSGSSTTTDDPGSTSPAAYKAKHYSAVLTPQPDDTFIDSLPDPVPLSTFLASTRRRILEAGGPALIGEVGLDKAFRLPWPWNHPATAAVTGQQRRADQEKNQDGREQEGGQLTPGGREGRTLSPHHVRMAHQVAVLKAQLRLAGELGVAVSVHGVQAHGVLFDALASLWKGHEKEVVSRRKQKLVAEGAEDFSSSEEEEEEEEEGGDGEGEGEQDEKKKKEKEKGKEKKKGGYRPVPFPPRVCLHSFSGSPQMVHQYLNPAIPVRVFFSFSTVINLSTAGGESKFPDVVRACPDDRVLVESDLHCAGEEMDRVLEDICRRVCEIKGWTLEEGLARIRKNYEQFVFG